MKIRKGFSKWRPAKSHEIPPVIERDFARIEFLARDSEVRDYVEALCLYRMAFLGYITGLDEFKSQIDLITGLFTDNEGFVKLPEKFEIAKEILSKIKNKEDFEKILGVL